ncbi:MAG: MMPL family transporter [bacterium]
MIKIFEWVIDYPFRALVAILFLTFFFASQMSKLVFEAGFDSMLPKTNATYVLNEQVKDRFSLKDPVIVVMEAPGTVYQAESLAKLHRLTMKIKDLPEVMENKVRSLSTFRQIQPDEGGFRVERIMSAPPEDAQSVDTIRKMAEGDNLVKGRLVGKDGKSAAIVFPLRDGVDSLLFYQALQTLLKEEEGPERFYISGRPVLTGIFGDFARKDMRVLFPLVLLVAALLMFIVFGNLRCVFLPLFEAMLTVLWTFGALSFFGVPLSPVLTMLPPLLVVVGVADDLYFLSRYQDKGIQNPNWSPQKIARETITELWRPLMGTSLTTMVGFLAFLPCEIRPLSYLGYASAFGILVSTCFTLFLIPAVFVLLPVRAPKKWWSAKGEESFFARLSGFAQRIIVQHPVWPLCCAGILLIVSLVGVGKIYIDAGLLSDLKPDSDIVVASRYINDHYSGIVTLHAIAGAAGGRDFNDPELLSEMRRFQFFMESLPDIGKSRSLADLLDRINRVMQADESGTRVQPETRELIAQYLFLYSLGAGPDEFEEFVDNDYRTAIATFFIKKDNASSLSQIISKAQDYLHSLKEHHIQWKFAGSGTVVTTMVNLMVRGQIWTLILAMAGVFIVVSLLMQSLAAGIQAIAPISLAVLFDFAILGFQGQPLGFDSILMAGMGIGIGVDFTIHFLSEYRHHMQDGGSFADALAASFQGSGKAILINVIVICSGYFVLLFSNFPPIRQTGWQVIMVIITSFFTLLFILLPVLRVCTKSSMEGKIFEK